MQGNRQERPQPGCGGRGTKLNIKGPRHFTTSQLLAVWFDLRNTAARLGRSGRGNDRGDPHVDGVFRGCEPGG
jgi:hypothetical protein